MKMKDVCERTGLTERTIRFYGEKGLVSPVSEEMNGRVYSEYREEDISRLIRIAALRKAGFTIESILEMMNSPDKIDGILSTHYQQLKQKSEETLSMVRILETVKERHFLNMEILADSLAAPTLDVDLPKEDKEPIEGGRKGKKPVICEACGGEITYINDLVVSNEFLSIVPYHEKCYAGKLKGLSTILVGNKPINGTMSNVSAVLFAAVGIAALFFKELWYIPIISLVFLCIRFYSWFEYERHL